MQRVTMVRYTTKPEHTDENEALSRAVFEEARAAAPEGVAYALYRDGDDFVHLFANLREDTSDAITELPSFKAYQAGIVERCVAPPQPVRLSLNLVDSLGFVGSR
jgi:hypothetical protein